MSKQGAARADAGSPWNSLEIAKLAVSTSTTVAIFVVGLILQDQQADLAERRDKAAVSEARAAAEYAGLLQKRAQIWGELGPLLGRTQRIITDGALDRAELEEVRRLQNQYLQIIIAYDLHFSERFSAAFDAYDSLIDTVLLTGRLPEDRRHWGLFQCLRRAAAKDMALLVDPKRVALETTTIDPSVGALRVDENLGCAGNPG